ncbi:MAG: SpoIID/LytB domain-containing protein [Planctomycetes bacterium]|nr:SpoIID/LytB domain-containing protein [Planctomycetota bacterium]
MGADGGWRIPASGGRWLVAAASLAVVAWTLALLPSGCQSPSASRTPDLPPGVLQVRPGGNAPAPQASPPSLAKDAPRRPPPPAQRPTVPASEPVIRVRVDTLGAGPVEFAHPSGWLWLKPSTVDQGVTLRSPVSVQAMPDGWRVVQASGQRDAERLELRPGGPLEIHPPRGAAAELQWRGGGWPGFATLVPLQGDGSAQVDLVFHVPMETYLPGVLAKELYKEWAPETYRAQAVAARSYAMCEHAWWQGRRHFDVVAGQASQAWVGATADPKSRDAVADTRGEYLVFDGRVVPAYYSSCCGGAAASATDAIRDGSWMDIAPLSVTDDRFIRAKNCCEKARTASWRVTLPADEFARRLNTWSRDEGRKDLGTLKSVRSISVAERNPAGRPTMYRIVDAGGRKALWGSEDLRYAINGGASGTRDALKSGYLTPRVERGSVVLEGRGHGHGAGMCQYGAETMAKAGRAHAEILRRYYPGATLESSPSSSVEAR